MSVDLHPPATPPVRFGVLGVSAFAMNKLLPAMRLAKGVELAAIASRDFGRACEAASVLAIPRAYGGYEDLLADASIEAIYIPLPNHLHTPYAIHALQVGKHVLCEKPAGLNAAEIRTLIEARGASGKLCAEAFMIRTHPQWERAVEIVRSGALGPLRMVTTCFSYSNLDPSNVRNVAAFGGGGMYDIGCYAVYASRLLFGEEPLRASALFDLDPACQIDRLATGLLEFPSGHAHFHVSIQLVPYQRVIAFGTKARLEIEVPFNAPKDTPCRLWVDDGSQLQGGSMVEESFPVCDQYAVQGERFARAIRGLEPQAVTLEDSLGNALAMDAVFDAARTREWVPIIPD
ncbi:MAG TPA: Gfo/Idh/MocA family oxidoreductase [Bryobacteraceae bacterium]|nr:Gfo/Idh/MocA family oxidoreductase [Bryobacteraceae bacterium]